MHVLRCKMGEGGEMTIKDTPQTATVSDEAVQAAQATYSTFGIDDDMMRVALTAAIPHLSQIVTKPVDGSMTPEEFRLEDIKQMASYTGSIVSFETRDPYYLASCDCCGWVGSSELCGTDSFGDDSDVYCPRCHASGADSGMVAERISAKPVDVAAVLEKCAQVAETPLEDDDRLDLQTRTQVAAQLRALSPAKPVDQFKAEFKRGYILACCNLINMHGTNTETIDLFQQLGITQDEIAAMDLSEYDLSALTDLETAYGLEKMYGTPAAPTSKGGE